MKKIAILASGNGSNAENIIRYFKENDRDAQVAVVICNRKEAGVYERVSRLEVPCLHVSKSNISDSSVLLPILEEKGIDFIVLAGYMLMVPDFLLEKYPKKIINIHPSLLPKYGGKGMYGHFVHKAVIKAGEKESGITIHYVNDKCDEGEIIFQAKVAISSEDTPETLEHKIHNLEWEHFPKVVDQLVSSL